jgi:hypothetical protein
MLAATFCKDDEFSIVILFLIIVILPFLIPRGSYRVALYANRAPTFSLLILLRA